MLSLTTISRYAMALLMALSVLTVTGCASQSGQSSTGQYIDDSVITTKVKSELFKETDLKSGQISVETYKGVVQLSGFVNNRASINKAVEITRKVEGVKSVKNSMVLR